MQDKFNHWKNDPRVTLLAGIALGDMVGRLTAMIGWFIDIIVLILAFLIGLQNYRNERQRKRTPDVIVSIDKVNVAIPAPTAKAMGQAYPPKVWAAVKSYNLVIVLVSIALIGLASYQIINSSFSVVGMILFVICYLVIPVIICIDILFLKWGILKRIRYGRKTKR